MFLNLAGFKIQIILQKTKHVSKKKFEKKLNKIFKGFFINECQKIDYIVEIQERLHAGIILNKKKDQHFSYHLKYMEEINDKYLVSYYDSFYYQIIMKHVLQKLLNKNGGLMLHASAVLFNTTAYLFLGKSGAGKSTAKGLLSKKFKPLSDDFSIVRQEKGKLYYYQTPFLEKELINNISYQRLSLKRLFFLKKSEYFSIIKLDDTKIKLDELISNSICNMYANNYERDTIETLIKTSDKFEMYYLFFRKDKKGLIDLLEDYN